MSFQENLEIVRCLAFAKRTPGRKSIRALTQLLASGRAPTGLYVHRSLDLSGGHFRSLPADFHVRGSLNLMQCPRLRSIGPGLHVTGTLYIGGGPQFGSPFRVPMKPLGPDSYCPIRRLPDLTAETLQLHRCNRLSELPGGLRIKRLFIDNCAALSELPDGLDLESLWIRGCGKLRKLPTNLRVKQLSLQNSGISEIPPLPGLRELRLIGCHQIEELPDLLGCHLIWLRHLRSLRRLPERIHLSPRSGDPFLSLRGLPALCEITSSLQASSIEVRGCDQLERFAPSQMQANRLALIDCPSLRELPARLDLSSDLFLRRPQYLALSGCSNVTSFPPGFAPQGLVYLDDHAANIKPPRHLTFRIKHGGRVMRARTFYRLRRESSD